MKKPKKVAALTHDEASRKNIPTAEYQSVMEKSDQHPIKVAYQLRNQDLDPQLIWRGKDSQDWPELIVRAHPLFIQEKIHPKALISDLQRHGESDRDESETKVQGDIFSDFNGLPNSAVRTEFYQHDANWSNRMILGDSLQAMASLTEREGLRGKVQCIYLDPPYGIKFNSNFQWSTTSRSVKDGKRDHITREPEQVKAFRDTWRDGIHSYLTYLRDRFTVARDLLAEGGSIFVQIGGQNVHRVRMLMDEVFGENNYIVTIKFAKTTGLGGKYVDETFDYLLWFAKDESQMKYRRLYLKRVRGEAGAKQYKFAMSEYGSYKEVNGSDDMADGDRLFSHDNFTAQSGNATTIFEFDIDGFSIKAPEKGGWKSNKEGVERLQKAHRLIRLGNSPRYVRYFDDSPYYAIGSAWLDTVISGFGDKKVYVVQTLRKVVERCILMTTDPGDLVLDPTCGSGTTAYAAEQWGRRWITIDTSRVALALARARIMGARFPYYLLADTHEGQKKAAEIARTVLPKVSARGDIRDGFVYKRVPHVSLKSITNNTEVDAIWEKYKRKMDPLRQGINEALQKHWEEWDMPRYAEDAWDDKAKNLFQELLDVIGQEESDDQKVKSLLDDINSHLNTSYLLNALPPRPAFPWAEKPKKLHAEWWSKRLARQREIDKAILAKADYHHLYDQPYEDKNTVRVAGPFTVESLSPHRILDVDDSDEMIDRAADDRTGSACQNSFTEMILEQIKIAGVQQAHKEDKITFSLFKPWPGQFICAEGGYTEKGVTKRAGIMVGPEFGTVSRQDLVDAAKEAGDADFDLVIACAFNYDAHATEFKRLGRVPVLKARMNTDLHMAEDLRSTGRGNLFVIFGEPDISISEAGDRKDQIQVTINGVDVFHPNTGEVRSDGPEGIACWFIDTDYDGESFFVRHAYFLGANDPYKMLKTTLKSEINKDAWATLCSNISRPFNKPSTGRIAVKVINHLGDEVMKVFRV